LLFCGRIDDYDDAMCSLELHDFVEEVKNTFSVIHEFFWWFFLQFKQRRKQGSKEQEELHLKEVYLKEAIEKWSKMLKQMLLN
jgi:hypothetical protein